MKLAAIYNVWHDWEMLWYSYRNLKPLVDGIIIVGSTMSNSGEYCEIPEMWRDDELFIREPVHAHPMHSETDKRNFGLDIAKKNGYTHFLTIDADEFYHPEQFLKAKQRFHVESNLKGLVCPCNVYFKSPTLTIGRDVTLVPFIHELTPTIKHEFNRKYPFAWDKKGIRIDPTRSLNINSGVDYTKDVVMEHMSWVRKDIEVKIRNSSARANIERSTVRQDFIIAKVGEFCNFYGKVLHTVANTFNIPDYGEFLRKDLQPDQTADKAHKPNI